MSQATLRALNTPIGVPLDAAAPAVCARCGYDLAGLPRRRPCPECASRAHARPWPGWMPVYGLVCLPAWAAWIGLLAWPAIVGVLTDRPLRLAVLAPLAGAAILWSVLMPVLVGFRVGVKSDDVPHRPRVRRVIWRAGVACAAGNTLILAIWAVLYVGARLLGA